VVTPSLPRPSGRGNGEGAEFHDEITKSTKVGNGRDRSLPIPIVRVLCVLRGEIQIPELTAQVGLSNKIIAGKLRRNPLEDN
jgi:hypothetical protein